MPMTIFFMLFLLPLAFSETGINVKSGVSSSCRGDLMMNILGITSDQGQVKFDLAGSKDAFDVNYEGPDFLIRGKARVENYKASYIFKNIPCGEYAVQSYHDENMNETLDFKFFRVPKEKYGFSNCEDCILPPKWEVAKFTFDQNHQSIEITLH